MLPMTPRREKRKLTQVKQVHEIRGQIGPESSPSSKTKTTYAS